MSQASVVNQSALSICVGDVDYMYPPKSTCDVSKSKDYLEGASVTQLSVGTTKITKMSWLMLR